VVRPHDEADHADRDHGIGHAEIAEHRLLREGRDDLADDAEARQDHDVHFGVAEEPEEMLVKHRIAAAGRIKEGRAEIAVGQQHGDRRGQNRQRQQQQEGGDQHRPHEQRHLVQVMPGARMLKMVVMKLIAPMIDAAPARWSEKIAMSTAGPANHWSTAAHRPSSRSPAPGPVAARHEGRDQQRDEARNGQPEADMLFMRGKAMSGAPIMIGTNQLPKPPMIAGMTMKNTMIRPCAVISTFHMQRGR
jgi:hypothetical protein